MIVLGCLLSPIFAREARSQTRAEAVQLQSKLDGLVDRVSALERVHRVIVCGRMDSDLMEDGIYSYPMSCHSSIKPKPPQSFDGPRLTVTLIRPGIFKFEFNPRRLETPIVLA